MCAGRGERTSRRDGRDRAPLAPQGPLLPKFDIESFSDFTAKSSNFRRLFLFCIEADFGDQILILQHFSRSTRFSILCTAQIQKFQPRIGTRFHIFVQISAKVAIFNTCSLKIAQILTKISRNFAEYFEKCSC